ncbi:NIPSNAP family protein [Persicitalea jodogahamensis]|uniref:NIPSNAP domain-containing protein n=1 Tax=Persicitalea jodogahamensis TaxID=402147 RepID=A0A8J3D3Q6_9BACT|nr:NIPSNAP family protein [Persicitalea jodogahamensis]GHB69439.1 hypothetical protein GCM10007390_23770 [Persicitalea jodogahamensis]
MNTKYLQRSFVLRLLFSILLSSSLLSSLSAAPKPEYYELKIYHVHGPQMALMDNYLQNAYLPAAHRAGIKNVGVFKALDNDSLLYVLTPFQSLDQLTGLSQKLSKDKAYLSAGKEYIDSPLKEPAYQRFETVILEAFDTMPVHAKPGLTVPVGERVYELRDYESSSEKRYLNKVRMFDDGGEVEIFKRLGFNPVFFAKVIAGSHMPNLMYLITFSDKASRDAHWKAFGADAEWSKLKSMPEYQENTSKTGGKFVRPTAYSDI